MRHLVWLGLVACAGGDSANETGDALSYARDIAPRFDADCIGCHQPIGDVPPSGGLDLIDPLTALLDVPSSQAIDMDLVLAGDHLYSYLWHKVNGSQSIAGGSGTSMPLGGVWSDDDIALLADWIDQGAAP
jgi:hypothetical protein